MPLKDQFETMTKTIIDITNNVVLIANADALKPPVVDIYTDLIKPNLMTERQIVKKMLITTSGVIPPLSNIPEAPAMDPKTAHLIVYGKFKYKSDGTLSDNEIEDPDCVYRPNDSYELDKNGELKLIKANVEDRKLTGTTMPIGESFPLKTWVKQAKSEVKRCFKQIGLKTKAIETAADSFINSITIAAATIPGYSLPTAVNPGAIKKTFKDVSDKGNELSSKINDLIDYFDPILAFLPFLLPDTQIVDSVLSIINGILLTINTILTIVANLMPAIITVTSNIPYPDVPSIFTASDEALAGAISVAKEAISYAKTAVGSQVTNMISQVSGQVSAFTNTVSSVATTVITAGQAATSEAQKASQRFIVVIDTSQDQSEATFKLNNYKSTQQYKFDNTPEIILNTAFNPPLTNEPTFLIIVAKNLNQTDADKLVQTILNDNPTLSSVKVRSINAGNI